MNTTASVSHSTILLALVAMSAVLWVSCSSSSETSVTGPTDVKCAVQARLEPGAFAPDGGAGTLAISTNRECEWSAKTDAAWIALSSPASGQGTGTVQFTVAANANAAVRSAGISVNDQRVEVSQDARRCELTVSSHRESVDAAGGDRTIDVRANAAQCAWTAASNVAWITIVSGRQGTGNGAVTLHVDPVSGPPRNGTITVAGETVQIDQGTGCSFAINATSFSLDASGGDRQVTVAAPPGCAWTSATSTSWIALTSGTTGSGPGVVSFRVAPTDGPARTGTLTVAGSTVWIAQGVGCSVSIAPSGIDVGAQGGPGSVAIETAAGCGWSAASSAGWITVTSAGTGAGSSTLQILVASNTGPARSGSVTISGQTVAIRQANGCTYSVSPTTVDMPGGGGTGTATVTTGDGCAWTAASDVSWMSPSSSSGAGSGQVTFPVAENSGPPRAGTITIANRTVSVNQASPCSWIFVPPFHDIGASGGAGNVLVIVTGVCTWTAVSTVDWIQVTAGASGAGNGLLQFTVGPNTGPRRTGIVLIAGQSYTVQQGGQ